MTPLALVAAAGVGAGAAAVARLIRPPTPRLAGRLRPYATISRHALGLSVYAPRSRVRPSRPAPAGLARLLEQSRTGMGAEEFRVRQLVRGCVIGAAGGVGVAITVRAPLPVLAAAMAGFFVGATGARRRIERAVALRAERIRLELYTVNQLLAISIRTGAGVVQAIQRVVDRGRGFVVEELGDVLTWMRSGMPEVDALMRAAEHTPEPSAARTYRLLATGAERGADLGRSLLALRADLRDERRELLHKAAVRRRAAMLVPTIGILAPIMLLFIAAPLPRIVLGYR
jgi:Flp pilus assembly protein TadB